MAQPTISSGFTTAGVLDGNNVTTLVWGTDGLVQSIAGSTPTSNTYAGTGFYIVESIDQTQKNEQIYGENGTGIESWRVILTHGNRWNITVQDSTQMTPPLAGTTVSVIDINGGRTSKYNAIVLNSDYRAARKQAGHRVIVVESLTLVDAAGTSAT